MWCHKYRLFLAHLSSPSFFHLVIIPLLTSIPSHSAEYYVKVMKKIQDRGDEYIQNEHDRLGRLLSKLYHP